MARRSSYQEVRRIVAGDKDGEWYVERDFETKDFSLYIHGQYVGSFARQQNAIDAKDEIRYDALRRAA